MKKISILIQARMGSTRLPGKVLLPLGNKEILSHLLDRLPYVKKATHCAVVIPKDKNDDVLAAFLSEKYPTIDLFRGSEKDVLSRYFEAAQNFQSDIIVRLTSDCPLLDPKIIDATIDLFLATPDCSYASNTIHRTFPRGMDIEVFSFQALKTAFLKAQEADEREHVTLYMYRRPKQFHLASLISPIDLSSLRLTVDEPQDLMALEAIYSRLPLAEPVSTMKDIEKLYSERPELFALNSRVQQKPVFIDQKAKEELERVKKTTSSL